MSYTRMTVIQQLRLCYHGELIERITGEPPGSYPDRVALDRLDLTRMTSQLVVIYTTNYGRDIRCI